MDLTQAEKEVTDGVAKVKSMIETLAQQKDLDILEEEVEKKATQM